MTSIIEKEEYFHLLIINQALERIERTLTFCNEEVPGVNEHFHTVSQYNK